jgi:anthranilate phosphoribosyltransferase
VLNAAAALYVTATGSSFGDCVAGARSALEQGAGFVALDRLRTAYRRAQENQ